MSAPILRPGMKRDASDMAILADMAGHGMPGWMWNNGRGAEFGTAMEVGRARALREEGAFSWRNAQIAEIDGRVAGMLVGYRQPDEPEDENLDELPEPIRPLVELEALAPATWYVNIIAVFGDFRRAGAATLLMQEAERLAVASKATGLSLIVEDVNSGARALYEKLGYRDVASRPYVPFPEGPDAANWVLMIKPF